MTDEQAQTSGHGREVGAGVPGGVPAGAATDSPTAAVEQAVRDVVEAYVRGCAKGDARIVARAFRDDARMHGWLGDDLVSAPIGAFLEIVEATKHERDWVAGYSYEIRDVVVSGRVARAVLVERGYRGADFVNEFALLLDAGCWRIASKTFTTV